MERLEQILKTDPLRDLTDEDKALLWVHRHHFVQRPTALCKLLQVNTGAEKMELEISYVK